ncbi:hypothetical protein PFISCL1PPCAC_13591, partial [Pristionchus fissidentatus]
FVMCAPITMTIIFFVRRRLIEKIASVALTYQMLLPSGLGIAATVWIVDLMGIAYGEFTQRSEMGIASLFALASPLINLYFLPPYRRFL